jgi:hypothetical protein
MKTLDGGIEHVAVEVLYRRSRHLALETLRDRIPHAAVKPLNR